MCQVIFRVKDVNGWIKDFFNSGKCQHDILLEMLHLMHFWSSSRIILLNPWDDAPGCRDTGIKWRSSQILRALCIQRRKVINWTGGLLGIVSEGNRKVGRRNIQPCVYSNSYCYEVHIDGQIWRFWPHRAGSTFPRQSPNPMRTPFFSQTPLRFTWNCD